MTAGPACGETVGAATVPQVDAVIVYKKLRRLDMLSAGHVVGSMPIRLGRQPTGAKARDGDGRTPEGGYTIDRHVANSAFHLALHISYPNGDDLRRARRLAVPPGGGIEIHGLPNWALRLEHLSKFRTDWTQGCIAVSNADMDILWQTIRDGTPIDIKP